MLAYETLIDTPVLDLEGGMREMQPKVALRIKGLQGMVRTYGRLSMVEEENKSETEADFYQSISSLYSPGYGTENMALLLHALVRFVRPRVVLEVGVGYTTPWIIKALRDNEAATARDRAIFPLMKTKGDILGVQMEHPALDDKLNFFNKSYDPLLFAIDDYSLDTLDFTQVSDRDWRSDPTKTTLT